MSVCVLGGGDHVCVYVEARDLIIFPSHAPSYFLTQRLTLNLELIKLAKFTGQ